MVRYNVAKVKLVIAKARTTAEEFEELAVQLGPCELVRGEVVHLSPAGFNPSRAVSKLSFLIEQWCAQSKLGRTLSGEAGLIIERDPDTVRGADVAYFSYNRLPRGPAPAGFLETPPELIAEFVGKGHRWRELVEKAGEYLRMGVDCVWVFDPKERTAHVFKPDSEPTAVPADATLAEASILPGFSCTVREIFED
jgi:Uma2 family endonuclease